MGMELCRVLPPSWSKYLSQSVLPDFQGPPPHHHHSHLLDYHWNHYSPNSFLPVLFQHCPTFWPPYLSSWQMQGNLYCGQKLVLQLISLTCAYHYQV